MWQFQYKHGDRPLEGYTIQRAAGRGGFGEVYYAVSDSGREVALKAVTGYEQIELRGISQCMNLKNPHLVTIFDVKHNDMGRPFVLMEYVAGPSLRQLLDESPGGLGTQKSAFFLREIAKGLTYLHECGIVHRDLKPGNIFYENGYVKIGDYGLSKAIAPTQHSGQTITVGTVHYMAPEIGGGRYDKSIDIYAMGAVLFEMLTGQPPFLGASAGEILLKHVSTEADVANIEEPFKTVIRKAMAKDPADRYQSIQEMVEAVFGAEHVQQSVSCFSPDSLSMVAQRVAQRVAVGGGSATPPPVPGARGGGAVGVVPPPIPGRFGDRVGQMFDTVGDRLGAFGNRVAGLGVHALPRGARRDPAGAAGAQPSPGDPALETGDALCDPLSKRQRRVLALIILCVVSAATGILTPLRREGAAPSIILTLLATAGAAAGMLLAGHRILPQMNSESGFLRKLAAGGTAAALMLVFGLPIFASAPGGVQSALAGTALALIAALLIASPPDLSPSRPERMSFSPAIGAAIAGFVVNIFTDGNLGLVVGILAGTYLLAQVLSPWDPFAAKRREQMEDGEEDDEDESAPTAAPAAARREPSWAAAWQGMPAHHGDAPTMAWPPAAQGVVNPPAAPLPALPPRLVATGLRPVPLFMRWLWLAGLVAAIPTGVALLFAQANNNYGRNDGETAAMIAFGAGALLFGVLCLAKTFQSQFRNWWRYAFRWVLMWACCQTILTSGLILGMTDPHNEAAVACIFFIVMPAVLLPIMLFVRFSPPAEVAPAQAPAPGADPGRVETPAPFIRNAGVNPAAPQVAGGVRSRKRRRHRVEPEKASLASRFLGFVGDMTVGGIVTALLLLALLAGCWLAFDIPGMLNAGLPHPGMPAEMTDKIGTDRWPQMFRVMGYVAAWATLLMAAIVLMVARRRTYGLHMLRGVLGVGLFAASLFLLGHSTRNAWWGRAGEVGFLEHRHLEPVQPVEPGGDVVTEDEHLASFREHGDDGKRVEAAVERYFNAVDTRTLALANVVALLSLLMMCWPARRASRGGRGEPGEARRVVVQQHFGPVIGADAQPGDAGAAGAAAPKQA